MSEGTLQNAAGNAAAPRIDDPPTEEAASVALEWRRTTVAGRRATFGVGGDGPPVVFLHGWALSGRTYRDALSRLLALPLRVLAPTLPGFGGTASLRAPKPTIADYAHWVAQFVESVGIDEPAVVMGHSFGGAVAIKLAHDFPTKVRGLVLVNSVGGSAWRENGTFVRSMAERPLWDWGIHLPRDIFPAPQMRRVLPVILADAVPNMVRNPRTFWHTASLVRFVDLSRELDELKARRMPVVVLWGDQDRIVTRASFDALCEALGDPAAITVPGNHAWMIGDPLAFAEVITNVMSLAPTAEETEEDVDHSVASLDVHRSTCRLPMEA